VPQLLGTDDEAKPVLVADATAWGEMPGRTELSVELGDDDRSPVQDSFDAEPQIGFGEFQPSRPLSM
jgi:hypothetical protein